MAIASTSTVSAMRLMPRSSMYSAAAARTGSLTLAAGTLPATRLRTSLSTSDSSLAGSVVHPRRQVIGDQPQDDRVLEREPEPDAPRARATHTTARSSGRSDWEGNADVRTPRLPPTSASDRDLPIQNAPTERSVNAMSKAAGVMEFMVFRGPWPPERPPCLTPLCYSFVKWVGRHLPPDPRT